MSEKSSSSNCSFNVYINTNIWIVCRLLMQILQDAFVCIHKCVHLHMSLTHGVFCSTAFPSVCIVRILDEFGILIMYHIPVAMKLASFRKFNSLFTECSLVTPGADAQALWRRDIILSSSARNTKVTLVLFSGMGWVHCHQRIQWWAGNQRSNFLKLKYILK